MILRSTINISHMQRIIVNFLHLLFISGRGQSTIYEAITGTYNICHPLWNLSKAWFLQKSTRNLTGFFSLHIKCIWLIGLNPMKKYLKGKECTKYTVIFPPILIFFDILPQWEIPLGPHKETETVHETAAQRNAEHGLSFVFHFVLFFSPPWLLHKAKIDSPALRCAWSIYLLQDFCVFVALVSIMLLSWSGSNGHNHLTLTSVRALRWHEQKKDANILQRIILQAQAAQDYPTLPPQIRVIAGFLVYYSVLNGEIMALSYPEFTSNMINMPYFIVQS